MRKIYKKLLLLTCIVLWCTCLFSTTVSAAENDLFGVANTIIRDVYQDIAGISTVLAGLMSAVAVIGAKMSNNQHGLLSMGSELLSHILRHSLQDIINFHNFTNSKKRGDNLFLKQF